MEEESKEPQKLVKVVRSKKAPAVSSAAAMTKELYNSIIVEQLSFLKDHQEHLKNLLGNFAAGGSDVSFPALENSKKVLDGLSEVKTATDRIRKAISTRIQARLKETA